MTTSKWILGTLLALCLAAPLWATNVEAEKHHGAGAPAPMSAVDDDGEDELLGALDEGDDQGRHGMEGDDGEGPGRHMRRGGHGGPRGRGHGGPGMRGMHRGHGLGLGFRNLDLSTSQREEIEAIQERVQRRSITARAELQEAGLDLRKLMREERPDRRAIEAQVDRISGMRGEIMKSRIGARLEALSVLTDEQRDQLRERRSSQRKGWDRRAPESLRKGGDS